MSEFELIQGTVTGEAHFVSGKPNQDASLVVMADNYIVAIVCDGCGEMPRSEVGAYLGTRIVARAIKLTLSTYGLLGWSLVQSFMTHGLRDIMWQLAGDDRQAERDIVNEALLFTIVAAVIGPERASFAAIGDGEVIVNGERATLGPFEGNRPPYAVYGLVGSSLPASALGFRVARELPTEELRHFVIGTDGVGDLIAAADTPIPGRDTPVGPVSQLWTDDGLYTNPFALGRRLTMINGGIVQPIHGPAGKRLGKRPGLLGDDTTIVAGRRRSQ